MVAGELDLNTRDDLITASLTALGGGTAVLELDLSGVTFCDSSGISSLLALLNMTADTGKRLLVSNAQGQVERALVMTGLLDRLTQEPS